MIDAEFVRHVGDMIDHVVERRAALAGVLTERRIGRDADHAAALGEHLEHVVGGVALVVGQRADVAMANDRRAARERDRLPRRTCPGMREVDDHAAIVDLADADAAEFGQAGVLGLERAAAEFALLIVHELHDALAEPRHDQDHARIAVELGRDPLAAEDDAEPALALGAADVVGG